MGNWITGIGAALNGVAGLALRQDSSALTSRNANVWWPYQSGLKTSSGVVVDECRAMQQATVFACSRAIAEALASLPGLVYEEMTEADRRRARDTPQWGLLHDSPNPLMDAMQFFELCSLRLVNRGNAFAEIERNERDEPIALWPIHPSRIRPWKLSTGEIEFHVFVNRTQAFGERPPASGQGTPYVVVPYRDMLNVCNFPSDDGVTSRGVLAYAREEMGVAAASLQYAGSWFGNGARPSGLIKHKSFIADETTRNTFRDDINRIHGGPDNANKVGILWDGAEWQSLQMGPDDAKLMETRSYGDKAICRFYNVPPAVVQIFDDYKFATVDAMMRQFVLTCIRSYAVRWERAINSQILRTRDERGQLRSVFRDGSFMFEFLLNALLRGDPKTQAEANAILRQWGVLNANEWRAQENMNPLSGAAGSTYIVPANFTTAERMRADLANGGQSSGAANQVANRRSPKWEKAFAAAMLKLVTLGEERATRQATEQSSEVIEIASNQQPANAVATTDNEPAERFASYAQSVLTESAVRMTEIECKAIRRAAEKPREFLPAAEEFYKKHEPRMRSAIELGVAGMLTHLGIVVQSESAAKRVTRAVIDGHMEQLLQAAECSADQLAARVESVVSGWSGEAETLHERIGDIVCR